MAVTLKQIAARAGVAPNTVSTVLNGRSGDWTSEKTRRRVFRVARELGYQPNRMARGLRLGTYNALGLIVPDLLNPFYAAFARALEKHLDARGYDLLIEDSEADLERERTCLSKILNRQIDGLVCFLMDAGGCLPFLEQQVARKQPLIFIGRTPDGLKADSFGSDFSNGMAEAISHLRELGHKRIGFISGLPKGQSEDNMRFRFFKDLLRENGLRFYRRGHLQCGHTVADAREAFGNLWGELRPGERPSAVIALNDLLAIGVIRAALDRGLAVPDDLSVVGVDNIHLAAHLPVPLTTIALPYEELARLAAERFFARKDGATVKEAERSRLLPTRLIVRESSGPFPRGG